MARLAKGNKGAVGISDDLGSAPKVTGYTSFGADIDLTAASPGDTAQVCRGVMVTGAGGGTAKLDLIDATGTQVLVGGITCTAMVGVFIPGCFRTSKGTTTTIAELLVFW